MVVVLVIWFVLNNALRLESFESLLGTNCSNPRQTNNSYYNEIPVFGEIPPRFTLFTHQI